MYYSGLLFMPLYIVQLSFLCSLPLQFFIFFTYGSGCFPALLHVVLFTTTVPFCVLFWLFVGHGSWFWLVLAGLDTYAHHYLPFICHWFGAFGLLCVVPFTFILPIGASSGYTFYLYLFFTLPVPSCLLLYTYILYITWRFLRWLPFYYNLPPTCCCVLYNFTAFSLRCLLLLLFYILDSFIIATQFNLCILHVHLPCSVDSAPTLSFAAVHICTVTMLYQFCAFLPFFLVLFVHLFHFLLYIRTSFIFAFCYPCNAYHFIHYSTTIP